MCVSFLCVCSRLRRASLSLVLAARGAAGFLGTPSFVYLAPFIAVGGKA